MGNRLFSLSKKTFSLNKMVHVISDTTSRMSNIYFIKVETK